MITGSVTRVLLIEDNPGDAELVRERLRDVPDMAYEVVVAGRMQQALERLQAPERVDVIVQLKQLENTLARYRHLSSAGAATAVTSDLAGAAPIRKRMPQIFEKLRQCYLNLFDDYLNQLVVEAPKPLSAMKRVVREIGDLGGGPRDLLDVHLSGLEEAVGGTNEARARAYSVEGRLLALEMMDLLVDYYRVGVNLTACEGESE